jgi:hypothetical protein
MLTFFVMYALCVEEILPGLEEHQKQGGLVATFSESGFGAQSH